MAGKVKRKEGERLDDANIETVIALLEQDKPITQKEACERLNIAVNGARLKKIIQEFKDSKVEDKRRRAANRGKAATEFEIATIIEDFLSGDSMKAIGDKLYRSTDFVKRVVADVGIPQAAPGEDYSSYGPLPEQCISESFTVGQFVWSSKYGSIAEIMSDLGLNQVGIPIYRIWVHQRIDPDKMLIDGRKYAFQTEKGGGFFANQCAYDLGTLEHLRKYGVDVRRAIK